MLPMLLQPGDEGLIKDAVVLGECQGALAAAVEGVQQGLALPRRVAEPAVAAGANDRSVRGLGELCQLHIQVGMLVMRPDGESPSVERLLVVALHGPTLCCCTNSAVVSSEKLKNQAVHFLLLFPHVYILTFLMSNDFDIFASSTRSIV